jgi:uroporphyrinogen-III synthase
LFVLLTRSICDNVSLSQYIEAEGLFVLSSPIIDIAPSAFFDSKGLLDSFQGINGLIITSRYIFLQHEAFWRQLPNSYQNIPLYVVGHKTAEIAKLYFHSSIHIYSHAQDLVNNVRLNYSMSEKRPVWIWLSGEDYALNFTEALKEHISISQKILYKANKITFLNPDIQNHLVNGHIHTILFYSKRSAEAFEDVFKKTFSLLSHYKALASSIQTISISQNVSDALVLPWRKKIISSDPAQGVIEYFRENRASFYSS